MDDDDDSYEKRAAAKRRRAAQKQRQKEEEQERMQMLEAEAENMSANAASGAVSHSIFFLQYFRDLAQSKACFAMLLIRIQIGQLM